MYKEILKFGGCSLEMMIKRRFKSLTLNTNVLRLETKRFLSGWLVVFFVFWVFFFLATHLE